MKITKELLNDIASNYLIIPMQTRKRLSARFTEDGALAEAIRNARKIEKDTRYTDTLDTHARVWFDKDTYIEVRKPADVVNPTMQNTWQIDDYRVVNQEIRDALKFIKEKTGITVPITLFDVFDDRKFFGRHRYASAYFNPCLGIVIRPEVFNPVDLPVARLKYAMYGTPLIADETGKLRKQTKREYIKMCQNRRIERIREVVCHEVGHWIHYRYFNFNPMYIRGGRGYARKNALENFAVGFQQWIMNRLGTGSVRYKRLDYIMTKKIQTTIAWAYDNKKVIKIGDKVVYDPNPKKEAACQ
jgi:hypothetical protein